MVGRGRVGIKKNREMKNVNQFLGMQGIIKAQGHYALLKKMSLVIHHAVYTAETFTVTVFDVSFHRDSQFSADHQSRVLIEGNLLVFSAILKCA